MRKSRKRRRKRRRKNEEQKTVIRRMRKEGRGEGMYLHTDMGGGGGHLPSFCFPSFSSLYPFTFPLLDRLLKDIYCFFLALPDGREGMGIV